MYLRRFPRVTRSLFTFEESVSDRTGSGRRMEGRTVRGSRRQPRPVCQKKDSKHKRYEVGRRLGDLYRRGGCHGEGGKVNDN